MVKRTKLLPIVFLCLVCFMVPAMVYAEIQTVVSTVRQPFAGSQSPDDARVAATAKAKREALEKAGTYIESLTVVKNHAVEKDEILALAAGVLKTKIVSQKHYSTDDAFGIEVVAEIEVDTSILEARVKKLLEDRDLLEKYQASSERGAELLARMAALEAENKKLKDATTEQKQALKQQFQNTTKALTAVDWYNKALDLRNYETFTQDVADAAIRYLTTAITLDPEYSDGYDMLGRVYYDKGDYDRAIESEQKALTFCLKTLRHDHPDVARSYNNLGRAYSSKGDEDRAIEYYQKTIAILGPEHPAVARIYDNLGSSHFMKGDYNLAVEYLQKALAIALKTWGPDDPELASSYNNLGMAYSSKGDYDGAIEYLQKALAILLKSLGPEYPYVATSFNNLGLAYSGKGDYDQAIEYHQKALVIELQTLGPDHPDVATSYNHLGSVYDNKGEYDQAIEYHQKALAIRLKALGLGHPSAAQSYNNLGGAYSDKGEYNRALEYQQKALEIYSQIMGEEHPSTKIVRKNIEFLKSKIH